jgi:hypothetical protein
MSRSIERLRRLLRSRTSPAVEAFSKQRDDPQKAFELLLWGTDGWLSGVEIVDYVDRHGDESPDEIPTPEDWQEPTVRS